VRLVSAFLLGLTLLCGNGFAYTAPTGIPDPGWGIDEVIPARPDPWTTEQAGYYYIEQKGTCTDSSNSFGYPGHARCTIPAGLTKGSRVEIKGDYDYSSRDISTATDATAPNGNSWSANSDGPVWITCSDANSKFTGISSGRFLVRGSYLYLDSVKIYGVVLQASTTNNTLTYNVDHFMLRNSTLYGNGVNGYTTFRAEGSTSSTVTNAIIYNNTFRDNGPMNEAVDTDQLAVFFGAYCSNVWVLENTAYNITGTAMFAGAQSGLAQTLTHHVYFGKNIVHDVNVGGISTKNCTNVITSQNTVYNVNDEYWSSSKCFGFQYGSNELWIINNRCYHARYGVKGGSLTGGNTSNVYIIGNLFYDISYDYKCANHANCPSDAYPPDAAAGSPDGGISLYGAVTNAHIIGNTVYDAASGINQYGGGNYVIENNLISEINETNGCLLCFYNPSGTYSVDKDILYDSADYKIVYSGSTYTSLAAYKAGQSKCANCLDSDPLLVGPPNSFALQASSQAVGAGLAAASLTLDVYALFNTNFSLDIAKDLIGTTRPQDGTWDIGAIEYLTEGADTTAPTLSETTPVSTPTTDSTPSVVVTVVEANGCTPAYSGAAGGGDLTSLASGANTITFGPLQPGVYTASLTCTDASANTSDVLDLTFTVKLPGNKALGAGSAKSTGGGSGKMIGN